MMDLQEFLLKVLVILSICSLILWTIGSGLMPIIKKEDYNTWSLLLVPFQLIIVLMWSFLRMVKSLTIREYLQKLKEKE